MKITIDRFRFRVICCLVNAQRRAKEKGTSMNDMKLFVGSLRNNLSEQELRRMLGAVQNRMTKASGVLLSSLRRRQEILLQRLMML